MANFILLTLRQLQMARQWRRQAEIALSFDDLTEGHYGDRLMPFLEQAQQKIAASKWCDGEPLPQVKRRVAELEREKSACHAAIEKCRRAMHALQTKGGGLKDPANLRGGGQAAADHAIAKAQELWRECAVLCRSRRETAMLVESLHSLGELGDDQMSDLLEQIQLPMLADPTVSLLLLRLLLDASAARPLRAAACELLLQHTLCPLQLGHAESRLLCRPLLLHQRPLTEPELLLL